MVKKLGMWLWSYSLMGKSNSIIPLKNLFFLLNFSGAHRAFRRLKNAQGLQLSLHTISFKRALAHVWLSGHLVSAFCATETGPSKNNPVFSREGTKAEEDITTGHVPRRHFAFYLFGTGLSTADCDLWLCFESSDWSSHFRSFGLSLLESQFKLIVF